jgi:hypothetical protein
MVWPRHHRDAPRLLLALRQQQQHEHIAVDTLLYKSAVFEKRTHSLIDVRFLMDGRVAPATSTIQASGSAPLVVALVSLPSSLFSLTSSLFASSRTIVDATAKHV